MAFICAAVIPVLLLTGCKGSNDGDTNITGKVSVKTMRDSFGEEIKLLKSEEFDNISFENLNTYSFPDIDTITTYRVTGFEPGNGLSSSCFFENFVKYCEYFAPGGFSKEEIAEKSIVQGDFHMDNANIPNYREFKEMDKNGDIKIAYISLETCDIYLAYFGHGPYWYIGDDLKRQYNVSGDSPMKVDVFGEDHPIVYYTENTESAKAYPLADGEISIADAAGKANAIMAEIARQCGDNMTKRVVCAVNVIDIGNGEYGYYFTTTPAVDGMKYAYSDMRSGNGGSQFFSEESRGSGSIDHAFMIESGKFCSFTNAGGWKEKTPIETYDSIVPLKVAAKNAGEMLSGQMSFKAKSVTLVYDIKGSGDELVPCWRFVLENSGDREQYYHVYVNAITGEARVKAIQEVSSGYEYD